MNLFVMQLCVKMAYWTNANILKSLEVNHIFTIGLEVQDDKCQSKYRL
jgi:hypothetical protein